MEPHPTRNDADDDLPLWSPPERDLAAREAARRALARAAREHETERVAARTTSAVHRPRSRGWTLAAACAVVVLGVGTVSVAVRGDAPPEEDAEAVAGETSAARIGDGSPATSPDGAAAASGTDGSRSGASGAPVLDPAAHGAVYEGGHVTLRGTVPTRAMADALRAKAVAVVGAANVTDEYVIDPAAPTDVDGRVRIADPVLFRTGSAQLDPRDAPLLDAGVVLMALNPQVVLLVVGHTDDVGTEESNQLLSIERARSVVAYVQAKGGFADARFEVQGVGESQPIADNATVEGRTANRRIEVTILGLLVPPKS